ncbi:MAG: hypothetical protein ABIZ56_10940, partial [Chthoniobacteraceae bacterium]
MSAKFAPISHLAQQDRIFPYSEARSRVTLSPAPTMKLAAFLLCLSASAFAVNDPFAELVRPTEPLTPEQQRAAFHLPPG